MAKTTTRTEWRVKGLTTDGEWKLVPLCTYYWDREFVESRLEEYKEKAERNPNNYTYYLEYKLVKRQVTEIIEDWEEA